MNDLIREYSAIIIQRRAMPKPFPRDLGDWPTLDRDEYIRMTDKYRPEYEIEEYEAEQIELDRRHDMLPREI